MSKDSIAVINDHEYKYRYNPDTKQMDYRGPVGDAPPLTQEEFMRMVSARQGWVNVGKDSGWCGRVHATKELAEKCNVVLKKEDREVYATSDSAVLYDAKTKGFYLRGGKKKREIKGRDPSVLDDKKDKPHEFKGRGPSGKKEEEEKPAPKKRGRKKAAPEEEAKPALTTPKQTKSSLTTKMEKRKKVDEDVKMVIEAKQLNWKDVDWNKVTLKQQEVEVKKGAVPAKWREDMDGTFLAEYYSDGKGGGRLDVVGVYKRVKKPKKGAKLSDEIDAESIEVLGYLVGPTSIAMAKDGKAFDYNELVVPANKSVITRSWVKDNWKVRGTPKDWPQL
jgi:hypothetical protein